jgi:hypothetical protein
MSIVRSKRLFSECEELSADETDKITFMTPLLQQRNSRINHFGAAHGDGWGRGNQIAPPPYLSYAKRERVKLFIFERRLCCSGENESVIDDTKA